MKMLTSLLILSLSHLPHANSETSDLGIGLKFPKYYNTPRLNANMSPKPDCTLESTDGTKPLSSSSQISIFEQSFSRFIGCQKNSMRMGLLIKGRFSEESCKFSEVCRLNVLKDAETRKIVDEKLNKIIAKDHAMNLLAQNLEQLERLEMLKKYAEKEFGLRVPLKCSDALKIDHESTLCSEKYISDAFEIHQNQCDKGLACFREPFIEKGVKSFSDFKKENSSLIQSAEFQKHPTDLMVNYLNAKIDQKNIVNFSKSPQLIDELSSLVTSASFKKLSEEHKMKSIFRVFKSEAGGSFEDPVLSFDFDNNDYQKIKKLDAFKDMMKIVNNKNLNKDSFAKEFNLFRKKRAEVQLSTGSTCSNAVSLRKICSEATSLANGFSVPKDSDVIARIASESSGSSEELNELANIIGLDFGQNELNVLADAIRCQSFGITNQSFSPSLVESFNSSSGLGLNYNNNNSRNFFNIGARSNDKDEQDSRESGTKTPIISSDISGALARTTGTEGVISSADGGVKDPVDSSPLQDTRAQQRQESTNYNDYQVGPQPIGNGFNSLNHSNDLASFSPQVMDGYSEGEKPLVPKKAGGLPMASADERVSELLKKLAAAEEQIARVKADAEARGEDSESIAKKVAQDSPSIEDLKAQIAELKSQVTKKEVARAIENSTAATVVPKSLSNITSSTDIPQAARVESSVGSAYMPRPIDQASRDVPTSSNIVSSGRINRAPASSSSAPLLSMTVNEDGSKSTVLPSGDVVYSLDGLTPEKAALILTKQFKDLSKKSLLIEEGGVIKEVSPLNPDGTIAVDEKGNLTLNKIVRGRRTDKKFAGIQTAKQDRAPANAIQSAADLKRAEERKRIQLKDLRSLTEEAAKKN